MSDFNSRTADNALGFEAKYVTCEAIFDRESEGVFASNWLCVEHVSKIPENGYLRVEIEKHQLLIARGNDGEFRAFRNFCRHRGSRLVTENNCDSLGDKIRCPYHAWVYDRDGKLLAAPNMTDVDVFDKADYDLLQVACECWHGFVWVKLDGETAAPTASECMKPLAPYAQAWGMESLVVKEEINYRVAANWKLIFQNYSECYHCPTVHPALNRLTPYKGSSNDLDEGPILGGPMRLADDCDTMSMNGKAVANAMPGLSEDQKRAVFYFTLFPTMFLSFHPDYVLVHRLKRMGMAQTEVVCQFLFHPDVESQNGFDPASAVKFWDMTNKQDWEVCELAQQGMSEPGYVPGPYSNLESVLAAFDRHYYQQMKPLN